MIPLTTQDTPGIVKVMSSFTSAPRFESLSVEELPPGWKRGYRVTKGFQYYFGKKGSRHYYDTEKGLITNHASIPWILQLFFKPDDARWIKAVTQHDDMYDNGWPSKIVADALLFESMSITTPKWICWCFFLSVLFFGGPAWRACRGKETE